MGRLFHLRALRIKSSSLCKIAWRSMHPDVPISRVHILRKVSLNMLRMISIGTKQDFWLLFAH